MEETLPMGAHLPAATHLLRARALCPGFGLSAVCLPLLWLESRGPTERFS